MSTATAPRSCRLADLGVELDSVGAPVVLVESGLIVAVNAATEQRLGWTADDLVGRPAACLVDDADQARLRTLLQPRPARGARDAESLRWRHAAGRSTECRAVGRSTGGAGVLLTLLEAPADITPAAGGWDDRLLVRTERLCRSGSIEIEMPSGRVWLSAGMRALLGVPADDPDAVGLDALAWVPHEERAYIAGIWRCATLDEPFEFQHRLLCADGSKLIVLHRGVLQAGEPGQPPRGVAILQDITAQREAERRLQEVANTNEISGLPNRKAFLDQLDAAAHAAAWSQGGFTVFAIDVPRISEIKASMGFGAGDALSMAMAARLCDLAEAGESAAHLGEHEFALLVEHADSRDAEAVRARAARLLQGLEAPLRLGPTDVYPRCVIGIARFPVDAENAARLVECAQTARLGADAASAVAFFQAAPAAQALRQVQVESALRRAAEPGAMVLHYQPQVDLATGRVIGAEALLRWHDTTLGDVAPREFLPLAERAGLMGAIGDFALRTACQQAAAWRRADLPAVRISVNLSAAQLQRRDFAAQVAQVLAETGAQASSLGLELTERVATTDMTHAVAVLREIRALGVHIALDDFGTGFSSMSSLRRLPLDTVKVDRSLVHDVTHAADDVSMTRAIITMAQGLQIRVLVEGVETEDQASLLVANRCDEIQGHWFSPPLPADAFEALLREGRTLPGRLIARPRRAHRVLLVDDEENILSSLKRLLRRDGYQLYTASSAEEGLQRLAEVEVDVIVSDQRMPGMNGVEFLRRAKALHPDTVRMVLSGYTELQSIIDAVNEGAIYRFLTKPWDDQHLRAHIAEAVRHKDMADENRRLSREVERANADLASANSRLAQAATRQREHADLMAVNAGSMRDVLDELPAAVLCVDDDGLLAFANQAAETLCPGVASALGEPAVDHLPWLRDTTAAALPFAVTDHPRQPGSGRILVLTPRAPVVVLQQPTP